MTKWLTNVETFFFFFFLLLCTQPRNAEEDCTKALELDHVNIKALYRRAQARKVTVQPCRSCIVWCTYVVQKVALTAWSGFCSKIPPNESVNHNVTSGPSSITGTGIAHALFALCCCTYMCLQDLGRYLDAMRDLKTLLELEPGNSAASKEHAIVKDLWEKVPAYVQVYVCMYV